MMSTTNSEERTAVVILVGVLADRLLVFGALVVRTSTTVARVIVIFVARRG